MKSRKSSVKVKRGGKRVSKAFSSRNTNEKAPKSVIKKTLKPSKEPEIIDDDVIKSLNTVEEDEVYDQKAINEFMAQESLPEDSALVFKLTSLQQTAIFGNRVITHLNERVANLRSSSTLETFQTSPSTADTSAQQERSEHAVYLGLNFEKASLLKTLDMTKSTDALVVAAKEKVAEYPGEFITFIFDENMKFGGNFIMILSQDLDNTLRLEDLEVNEIAQVVDVVEEADDDATWVYPSVDKPWRDHGSQNEVRGEGFTESRARIICKFERPRGEFGALRALEADNAASNYVEAKPYEDKNFSIPIMELERGVTSVNTKRDDFTNTDWKYPRNQVVQYVPRTALVDEKEANFLAPQSQESAAEIRDLLGLFEQGLKENLMFNFLTDDFAGLGIEDDTYDSKSANNFKELITFSDLRFTKDKAIAHVEWHPTIEGLIAMSTVERLPYDERVNQLSRILSSATYIAIWSIFDPVQPQLLLIAPEDIYCFSFNPTDPHIVAGGCNNGEIVLWDISRFDLMNIAEKLKIQNEAPLFKSDENEGHQVPVIQWCATSNIEASHATPVTCLQWLPDHIELDRAGMVYENVARRCIQFLTCATGGGVFVWDLRPEKCVLAVDKTRDQMTMPHDVPHTFSTLDAKWKPLLLINLFRPDNAPDHCPTCFCIQERQGDRSVLEWKFNASKKVNTETDTTRVGLPKAPPLDGISTTVICGTEDGDMVIVDWIPQKDVKTAKSQTPMPSFVGQHHDGPIVFIDRSPFLPTVILCVGGFSWSLWKENVTTGPLLCSAAYAKAPTGGLWSPSRPAVFYIIRSDGVLEAWDLLDKTHEPTLQHAISSSALTALAIKMERRKHFIAVGDMHGILKILLTPHRLRVAGPEETEAMKAYIDREERRRAFVAGRWKKREQERVVREAESKRMAGIATVAPLSEQAKLQKLKNEYDGYMAEERQFLRQLGLVGIEEEEEGAEAAPA